MFCADLRKDSVSRCREVVLWKTKSCVRGPRGEESKIKEGPSDTARSNTNSVLEPL